jgi:adenosylcobinamide-GDP ribazoletransferase
MTSKAALWMKYLSIAFNLLTTLPVRAPADWRAGDSGRAAGWYPFVGLALGALVAAVYFFAGLIFPPLIAAMLALTAWVILTGGLHLDGLADCCDGVLHASNAEKRLEIMKDSRMGAFGGIGLFLILLLKFSALASLSTGRAVPVILLAASLGRWFIPLAGFQPLARAGGMGADFALGLKKSSLFWGGLIPLALAIYLGVQGILALGITALGVFFILRFARARIGGVTGDVFGLIVEISETILLITLTA